MVSEVVAVPQALQAMSSLAATLGQPGTPAGDFPRYWLRLGRQAGNLIRLNDGVYRLRPGIGERFAVLIRPFNKQAVSLECKSVDVR